MPTLQNIRGGSLVGDISGPLENLRDVFGTPDTRATARRQQQLEELRQQAILGALGGTDAPGQVGGIAGIGDPRPGGFGAAASGESVGGDQLSAPSQLAAGDARAMKRLSILAPEIATTVENIRNSGDKRQAAAVLQEAQEGARRAALISGQSDLAGKQRALRSLGADLARQGKDTSRVAELMNMDEPQLDLALERMKLGARDMSKALERFVDITGPEGQPVAQRNVETRRVVADPRAPGTKGGLFSAVTEIRADGSTIQAAPGGQVIVKDPSGNIAEGAERLQVLKNAEQAELEQKRAGAASKAAGTQSIKKAGEAIDRLANIKTSIANIDEAVKLIDEGAGSGPIMSRLPSIKSSSIALDNIQKRMGLDVIGDTTFGALSKGELDLALSTALPTGLKPPALKEWLLEKKAAQQKLAGYLENAAIFLGDPNKTASDWVAEQKELREETEGFLRTAPKTVDVGGSPVEVGTIITNAAGQRGRVEPDGSITVLQ